MTAGRSGSRSGDGEWSWGKLPPKMCQCPNAEDESPGLVRYSRQGHIAAAVPLGRPPFPVTQAWARLFISDMPASYCLSYSRPTSCAKSHAHAAKAEFVTNGVPQTGNQNQWG